MSSRSKRFTSSRVGGYDTVAIRMASPEDDYALTRVAALDSTSVPAGRVLVAEADGAVIAALSLTDGSKAADPFSWTSEVMELMEMRAEQIAPGTEAVPVTATSGGVSQLRTQLT